MKIPSNFGVAEFGGSEYGAFPKAVTMKYGFDLMGKLGKAHLYDVDGVSGIWQRRPTKRGKQSFRQRFYKVNNPNSPAQQAQRLKFKNAMTEWKALANLEKQLYIKRAKKQNLFGRNLFIKEYFQKLK